MAAVPLPPPAASMAQPLAAVAVAVARLRPFRLCATPHASVSSSPSPSTSAVSSPPPPARHSRKQLVGRDGAPAKPAAKPRVFFLDVNPICFRGSQRSLSAFARWLALFFAHVSLRDPVVAVLDGEGGNEYRRRLLPSYKAHRPRGPGTGADSRVVDVLRECNVPVVRVDGYEADDVVATLTEQVLQKDYRVVIGSPDKDFKQLISEDVQLVMPIPEIGRWSFYTLRHYIAQYKCDPTADLSLRCFIGDEADGVPGIQNLVPGFGRKTAVKLLKKHGSLENLLRTAAVRTVGKDYAQDALVKHADYLRKNYEVLSLKRDVNVQLDDRWLSTRDSRNDSSVLSDFILKFNEGQKINSR
ncbi:5'-3' exonuclease [Oryza brachyantha]|uniref:5'-3' exonuclease domain-containing protein n=1 Tax=Oryza brachyantha TaxID=4533 RepID=J3L6B3_ORYBR|nr:5'-3' exonuclease [Oryza brachyantha]